MEKTGGSKFKLPRCRANAKFFLELVYKKIPVAKPGPDEVLINIKFSGVCHTDLHAVNGDWPLPTKMPLVGGHEGSGVVVARGSLVEDVEIGDYAGVKVTLFIAHVVVAGLPLVPT